MEITKSYYDIREILKLYPRNISGIQDNSDISSISNFTPHPNLYWEGWGQTKEIAEETLKYIARLKTKVYILIVENNKYKDFIQFNPKGSPIEFKKYLKNFNKKIKWSEKEKRYIINNEWKFMSCILQDKPDKEDKHVYHKMFEKIMNNINLPNGMYIYSLRDVLLVHKKELYPWIDVVGGEVKMKNFPSKLLPIFNTTGGNDYWDIPIPNFEDKDYIYGKKPELDYSVNKPENEQIQINWNKKKPTAVFRGSASGCGYDEDTNPRIKISKISQILSDKENGPDIRTLLDAGLTSKSLKKKYRFQRDEGLGYFDFQSTGLKEAGRLNKIEQSQFKYLVYIEGNVAAHRLATDMLMGSVILYVESEYSLWFEHLMKENVHYLKIKSDLSDLIEKIMWCRKNDDICREMAKNTRELALTILTPQLFNGIFINYVNHFQNVKIYKRTSNNKSSLKKKPLDKLIIKSEDEYPLFLKETMYKEPKLMVNSVLADIFRRGKIVMDDGPEEKLIDAVSPREGINIYDIIKENKITKCLEVGMANGVSALYACQALKDNNLPNSYLISIDPFQSTQYKNIARTNIKRAGLEKFSIVMEEKSYDALPKLLKMIENREIEPFEYIFIDGMHLFDYTLVDFFYADLLLKVGGVILLDDIKHPNVKTCYNYIKSNYEHYKLIKTISSGTTATFQKIKQDDRIWSFHRGFNGGI
jgi:predicted O-methyltransferase YrrM